jgi:tyrosyl-tRNA synthetase
MNFAEELKWRGLIHQSTIGDDLGQFLSVPRTLYCGFDPTGDSLHVGHLLPLIMTMRFAKAGHNAIALLGGATGLIGDPSGKSAERNLQSMETVEANVSAIEKQVLKFVPTIVNNIEWTKNLTVIDFLQNIGKCFSINSMIQRDSVKSRLERDGSGISFTEFSYMLFQANDFAELNKQHGCDLQIGGSDQWGNMCSGIDVIRRQSGNEAHAITFPLLMKSDGTKFGKTAGGSVWLDPNKTSPWEFYQFWINTDDSMVIELLKKMTFLDQGEIESLENELATMPHLRTAQRALAFNLTKIVHGETIAQGMVNAALVIFGVDGFDTLSEEIVNILKKSLPCIAVEETDTIVDLLVKSGLESSKSAASRAITAKSVKVNDELIIDSKWKPSNFHFDSLFIRKGKKNYVIGSKNF